MQSKVLRVDRCLYTEDFLKEDLIQLKEKVAKINLHKIQDLIDNKIINSEEIINIAMLIKNIVNKTFSKFKILGQGEIKNKINLEANLSSKSAKEKIEKVGGKLTIKDQ